MFRQPIIAMAAAAALIASVECGLSFAKGSSSDGPVTSTRPYSSPITLLDKDDPCSKQFQGLVKVCGTGNFWSVENITGDKVVRLSPVSSTEKFDLSSGAPPLWALAVQPHDGNAVLVPPGGTVSVSGAPKANIKIDRDYTRRAILSKSIVGLTGASKFLNPWGDVGDCIREVNNFEGKDIWEYLNTTKSCALAVVELNPEKPLLGKAWSKGIESAAKLWDAADILNQL
jgi:hypothetical protein